MAGECEQLEPFWDQQLTDDQAEAFRRHLAKCAAYQEGLHDLMQLQLLIEDARRRRVRA